MDEKKYKSEALEKGLNIIELLAHTRKGLSKADIATQLNKTVSQIFRTICVLEQRQYVELHNGLYRLTHKLNYLVIRETITTQLISAARESMAEFSAETKQPCHLAIYRSGQLIVVHQVDPPTSVGVNIKIGSVIDVKTSGSGLCLLTFAHDAQRRRIVKEVGIDDDYFSENQNAIERSKINEIVSEPSKDIVALTNLSCPIYDVNDELIAVITSPILELYQSVWQERKVDINDIKTTLKETCHTINKNMRL